MLLLLDRSCKYNDICVCCWCCRSCLSNAYFARVGGISLQEMNRLELDFLFRVGFDLNVPPETFAQYCAMLRLEMLCLEPPLTLPAATAPEDDGSSSQLPR